MCANTIGGESESADATQICRFFVALSGLGGFSIFAVPIDGAD
jgi:hypothetical protein